MCFKSNFYPESNVVLVCKNDGEAQKCINDFRELIDKYKIIQPEISDINNGDYILFKNGSYIKAIEKKKQDSNQPIRGKRFDRFMDNIQDFIIVRYFIGYRCLFGQFFADGFSEPTFTEYLLAN